MTITTASSGRAPRGGRGPPAAAFTTTFDWAKIRSASDRAWALSPVSPRANTSSSARAAVLFGEGCDQAEAVGGARRDGAVLMEQQQIDGASLARDRVGVVGQGQGAFLERRGHVHAADRPAAQAAHEPLETVFGGMEGRIGRIQAGGPDPGVVDHRA